MLLDVPGCTRMSLEAPQGDSATPEHQRIFFAFTVPCKNPVPGPMHLRHAANEVSKWNVNVLVPVTVPDSGPCP